MKDPAKNEAALNSFSLTGVIAGIEQQIKTLQLLIHQDVVGKMPTDFKLMVPKAILPEQIFPYVQGDTVMVEDALLYMKDSEVRLRIESMTQIRGTTASPGDFNTLSFSGKIVETKEEAGHLLVTVEQKVMDVFSTSLDFLIPKNVKMETLPKAGDIGLFKSAILYDKEGSFRARIDRPTYTVLYSPDIVMYMGTVEAKEAFARQ